LAGLPAHAQTTQITWPAPAVRETAPVSTVGLSFSPVRPAQTGAAGLTFRQLPGRPAKTSGDTEIDFQVRIALPSPDILFRRESEAQVFERIRQEAYARPGSTRVVFPEREPVSKEVYTGRNFKQMVQTIEPSYVAHRRMYFEQPNFDRQGWELGALTPALTTGKFFYDMVALPYHTWTEPLRHWDTSAGKCLPGDSTPFYCYPERFSVTGLVGQVGAVAGGILVFP
jgi:hypothetical protein